MYVRVCMCDVFVWGFLVGFFCGFILFVSCVFSNSSDLLYTHVCTQSMFLPFTWVVFIVKKGTGNKIFKKYKNIAVVVMCVFVYACVYV